MKTNSLILLAVGIIGILFAILAPVNMKDKLIGVATFATNERQCLNFHKQFLNDPDSTYMLSSNVTNRQEMVKSFNELNLYTDRAYDKYEEMLSLKIKTKNQMGGYVDVDLECPIIKGKLDFYEADWNRRNPESTFEKAPAPE